MLRRRWTCLWQRLGAEVVPDIEPLLERLREPRRHYHTLAHVRHCLSTYDHGPRRDDVVELALWLHDAIYDPQAHDNEDRSADWCSALMRDAGIAAALSQRAHACILATRHRQIPSQPDECLTVSIDLAILGETSARFRRYDRDIRREYAWVPLDSYRRERVRVLRAFLERPTIFPSPWFEQRLSRQARLNLRQALAKTALNPPR